jgi:hypothetical protein
MNRLVKSGLLLLAGFLLGRMDCKAWYRLELVLPSALNPMFVSSSLPWYDSDEEEQCAQANERRRAWLQQRLDE